MSGGRARIGWIGLAFAVGCGRLVGIQPGQDGAAPDFRVSSREVSSVGDGGGDGRPHDTKAFERGDTSGGLGEPDVDAASEGPIGEDGPRGPADEGTDPSDAASARDVAAPGVGGRGGAGGSAGNVGTGMIGGVGGEARADAGAGDKPAGCGGGTSTTMQGTAFKNSTGPAGGGGVGKCGFPNAQLASNRVYGAVDPQLFAGSARCGVCMRVTAGGPSIDVTIIEMIQPVSTAHGSTIAIDPAGLSMLTAGGGNADVSFSFVPCMNGDTVRVSFASAADPTVLLMGHRNEVKSVRLATAAAAVDLSRQDYNRWTPPSGFAFSGGAVTITLIDIYDQVLSLPMLTVSATQVDTGKQFPIPACG